MQSPKFSDTLGLVILRCLLLLREGQSDTVCAPLKEIHGFDYDLQVAVYSKLVEFVREGIISHLYTAACFKGQPTSHSYSDTKTIDDFKVQKLGLPNFLDQVAACRDQTPLFSFKVRADFRNVSRAIESYLSIWKDDGFIQEERNIYKAERQLGTVVERIPQLLSEHPRNNLLIEHFEDMKMDSVPSLLFLESKGCLEVVGIHCKRGDRTVRMPAKINIRINVLSLFDGFFERDRKYSDSYLRYFLNRDSILSQRVVFQPEKTLLYQDKSYCLKHGSLPYRMIRYAWDNKTFDIPIDRIPRGDSGGENIDKGLQNFRSNLIQKFGIPEGEKPFSFNGKAIILNPTVFFFPY